MASVGRASILVGEVDGRNVLGTENVNSGWFPRDISIGETSDELS
jgi:hypothetical protein